MPLLEAQERPRFATDLRLANYVAKDTWERSHRDPLPEAKWVKSLASGSQLQLCCMLPRAQLGVHSFLPTSLGFPYSTNYQISYFATETTRTNRLPLKGPQSTAHTEPQREPEATWSSSAQASSNGYARAAEDTCFCHEAVASEP